ncbi:MAG TPA: DUF3093 domain-containing protein [Candidatus Nanopelagicaceae bacterium]
MPPVKDERILYKETVRPPLWLLAFIFFLLASVALSIWAAFDNRSGLIALILAVIALPVINNAMLLHIRVDAMELRVGRAHIERQYLDGAVALTIDQMRLTRGRDADPAAYLALRFWQPRGVKIGVRDQRDATPYWLISSKKANDLAQVLNNQKKEA